MPTQARGRWHRHLLTIPARQVAHTVFFVMAAHLVALRVRLIISRFQRGRSHKFHCHFDLLPGRHAIAAPHVEGDVFQLDGDVHSPPLGCGVPEQVGRLGGGLALFPGRSAGIAPRISCTLSPSFTSRKPPT